MSDVLDLTEQLCAWIKAIDITVTNQDRFEWPELRSLQGMLEVTVKQTEQLQAENTALREQLRWRDVDKELPEFGEECLLAQGDDLLLDIWERVQDKYSHPVLGWRWDGMDLENMEAVTHWVPLPTPPQGEKG